MCCWVALFGDLLMICGCLACCGFFSLGFCYLIYFWLADVGIDLVVGVDWYWTLMWLCLVRWF